MSGAERLREKAKAYEIEAAVAGEKVHDGAIVPPDLFFAIQKLTLETVAIALYEVASVIEEEIAA